MKNKSIQIIIASLLIVLAAISRVLLYPENPSPIIGMALFAGAVLTNKRYAFALPLFAMLLSDIIFEVSGIAPGFWGISQVSGYVILGLITILAFSIQKITIPKIIGYSLLSSVLFFILSNLSVFLIDNRVYHLYTQDWAGLKQCYIMALPFFKAGVIADLAYSAVLFGSYYLLNHFVINPQHRVAQP